MEIARRILIRLPTALIAGFAIAQVISLLSFQFGGSTWSGVATLRVPDESIHFIYRTTRRSNHDVDSPSAEAPLERSALARDLAHLIRVRCGKDAHSAGLRLSGGWLSDFAEIRVTVLDDSLRESHYEGRQRRAGWPARALAISGLRETPNRPSPSYLIQSGRDLTEDKTFTQRFVADFRDARPVARGMIVNSCFFAALCYLLAFLYRDVRAVARRRGGRCPKCGYDLRYHHAPRGAGGQPSHAECGGTQGCPECGWGRCSDPCADGAARTH